MKVLCEDCKQHFSEDEIKDFEPDNILSTTYLCEECTYLRNEAKDFYDTEQQLMYDYR